MNVCMHGFNADCVALDSQLVDACFPRKEYLFYSQFFSVACMWLRSFAPFPVQFGMSIGVLLVKFMFGQSYCGDFMGIASDVTRKHNITANSLTSSSYNFSILSSSVVSESLSNLKIYIYY